MSWSLWLGDVFVVDLLTRVILDPDDGFLSLRCA